MPLPEPSPWALSPLETRLSWVVRFRRLVAASQGRLSQLLAEELHRPRQEALLTDIAPLLSTLRWLENSAPRLLRDREIAGRPIWMFGSHAVERRMALGRVGIIAPWRYPVASLGAQMAHAIAAGNTVVVKPSERCAKTHTRILELAIEAGLPAGVLSWTGASNEAGANMLATQGFDHLVYSGSSEVGERVAAACAKTLTPMTMEVPGRDSVFVLEDAQSRKAARAVWGALTLHGGQGGTAPRRVLVLDKVYEKFIKEVIRLASKAGDVELVDDAASARCRELVAKSLARGARDAGLLTPMPPKLTSNIPREEPTNRFRITALIDCDPAMEVVEGRHCGALTAIVKCANIEEALAIHNRCDQHVSASIFTQNKAAAGVLALRLGVTNVTINDCAVPHAHPGVAMGGVGSAGAGVIGGEEGLLAMTRPVSMTMASFNAQRFAGPIALWKLNWASRIMSFVYEASRAKRRGLGKVLPSGTSTLPATDADKALAGVVNGTMPTQHQPQPNGALARPGTMAAATEHPGRRPAWLTEREAA